MSIRKILAGNPVPDDAKVFDGWKVFVQVHPSQAPDVKVRAGERLVRIKRSFLKAKGQTRAEAATWETQQLTERRRIDSSPTPAPLPVPVHRRTVRDLANHYFASEWFTEASAASRLKFRTWIEDFLRWNDAHGTAYADEWTQALALARRKYIRENHQSGGRANYNIYAKKLFELDMARDDGVAVTKNPFQHFKRTKAELQAKARLADSTAYTCDQMCAIMEHSTPYEQWLWTLLYCTLIRSSECTNLRQDDILFDNEHCAPIKIILRKTKTGIPRTVTLNEEAQIAMTNLLAMCDDSGYVVRRDVTRGLKSPLLALLNNVKRKAVKTYPQMRDALLGRLPVPDEEPKSVLRWVTRDGVRTQVSRETKGRFKTNVHSFRKTGITRLILEGRSPVAIAKIAGHTTAVLLSRYASCFAEDEADTVFAMPSIRSAKPRGRMERDILNSSGNPTIAPRATMDLVRVAQS